MNNTSHIDSNDTDDSNDTYEDQFMFEIERSIELGDCNIIAAAIRQYKNVISDAYIKTAQRMYEELVCEKMEEINI